MKPQKDQLTKEALEDLLLPSTPPGLLKGAPDDSDAEARDITAEIQLMVIAREGEPTEELIARQQAILAAIDICPSRIEAMRNSHPLGPFNLQIRVLSVGSASAPSKCGLGLEGRGVLGAVDVPDDMSAMTWGEICRHPHGSIRIPEGSTCTAAGFE